jgi:hypothetical protein
MSEFLHKSDQNFTAAEVLMKQHALFASSIHCAYYSCVQYMLHVINTKLSLAVREKFRLDILYKGSSHKNAIITINKELSVKNREDYKVFQRKVGELKKLREDADYTSIQMISDSSSQSYLTAQSIRTILKENFR